MRGGAFEEPETRVSSERTWRDGGGANWEGCVNTIGDLCKWCDPSDEARLQFREKCEWGVRTRPQHTERDLPSTAEPGLNFVRERSQQRVAAAFGISHHVPDGCMFGVMVLAVRSAARAGLAGLLRVRSHGAGKETVRLYLLSHKVGSVSGFHLERTVLSPQIDRVGDAGATPLVHLAIVSA